MLVVDDGSPGGIVRVVAESFGVECLYWPVPRGFCVAANAGVQAARGAVVELLNDDTEVAPGWAEAALSHFDDPGVAAVTPLVLLGPPGARIPERIDSAGDDYHAAGIAAKRGHGRVPGPEHRTARRVFGASGSSSFFRREVYLRVGGMPEEFGAYFDDVDLSFRLHQAGYDVVFEPASRVYHCLSSSYGRPCGRLLRMQSRNEELVFWRNLPAGDLARALPMHLAVLAGKAWRRAREGCLLPWLLGRLEVLTRLRSILRHRRRHLSRAATSTVSWGVTRGWPSATPLPSAASACILPPAAARPGGAERGA